MLKTLQGRWCFVLLVYLVTSATVLLAQDVASGATVAIVEAPRLTSVGAVVAAAIAVTYGLKRALVNVPVLSQVPVWCYVVLASLGLTYLGNRVLETLPGDFVTLAWSAVYNAAAASGIREWVYSGVKKPLAASAAPKP